MRQEGAQTALPRHTQFGDSRVAATFTYHEPFTSPTVRVGDFHCRPTDKGCGGEEFGRSDEFVFVRRGSFVKHTGRRAVFAQPNHVLFFSKGECYRVSHPVGGGDDCTPFRVRFDALRPILAENHQLVHDDERGGFRAAQAPCDPRLYLRHLRLLAAIRSGQLTDLAVEEQVLHLAGDLFEDIAAHTTGARRQRRTDTRQVHRDVAQQVMHGVAQHPGAAMSIERLARQAHVSPFHLCRLFREQTGFSIHAYRTQLRLRISLQRLAEGERDLAGLALDLGFADQSHFCNSFRGTFGVTPGSFRRSLSTRRFRETSKILQDRAYPPSYT